MIIPGQSCGQSERNKLRRERLSSRLAGLTLCSRRHLVDGSLLFCAHFA